MLHLSLCHYLALYKKCNYLLYLIIVSRIKSLTQHTAAPYTANNSIGYEEYEPIIAPDQNPKHNEHANNSSKYLNFRNAFLKNESIEPYFNIKHSPIHATV
jgi:hypothetical protein